MGYLGIKTTTHGTTPSRADTPPTPQAGAYLVINRGATTVYVGSSSSVTTGTGTALAPGQALPIQPTGTTYPQVWIVTASGTASVEHHYVK